MRLFWWRKLFPSLVTHDKSRFDSILALLLPSRMMGNAKKVVNIPCREGSASKVAVEFRHQTSTELILEIT